MTSADLVNQLGRVPVIRTMLRWCAAQYKEGSVVRIRRGEAAGMKWCRRHRYVNGYWTGIYEIPLQKAIASHLNIGDVFYDVGANAGFFTLVAAKLVGPEGRVFAFEPVTENVGSIREHIAINSLANCEVVACAVSDHCGTATFLTEEHNSLGHLLGNSDQPGIGSSVRTITLDQFAPSKRMPNFIKIDVEGAETEVLAGAHTLLGSEIPPTLLIELHGEDKARSVEATLSSYGYILTDLSGVRLSQGAAGHPHILARRERRENSDMPPSNN